MDTKFKYITTAALSVIVTYMISLGVDISVDTVAYDQGYLPYSCDLEHIDDHMCYKLSRVGETTGVNFYCYYNRDKPRSFRKCSTGWERIINTDDCPKTECKPIILSYITNCETGETDKFICKGGIGEDAECIEDGSLEVLDCTWG